LNIIRGNLLGFYQDKGAGLVHSGKRNGKINPDYHGQAERNNNQPAAFENQVDVMVEFKFFVSFGHNNFPYSLDRLKLAHGS
jgi:hypothetical protein